jgi:hypothetical protein
MRTSLPRIILSLAVASACAGWFVAQAVAGAPREYQMADSSMDTGQCQYVDQGPCAGPAEACDVPCEPSRCGPRWTFTADALALQRTSTRSQPLFTNIPQILDSDPLNAQDLNFGVAVGPRLSAIRHGKCGWDMEVVYFWLDGFTAEGNVPGSSQMVVDAENLFIPVTDGAARYTSALYSGEVNLRRQCCDWLTLLAGFRMGQLNEHYNGLGTILPVPSLVAVPSTTIGVGTNTYNQFYGVQLGADAGVYDMGGPLQINAICKAGVFGNVTHQNYQLLENGVPSSWFGASRDQAAFLGEAGVVARYALTKRLALRATAEAMWLTGVALAPEQISSVNLRADKDTVNTSGTVFYYGGGLGLEYCF